ncbi:MAG TPA: CrcB family protein [Marmoricola sp.]|jgi:CrcB protein|nr:CrcB family protein [Marmoricola sp.]
MTSGRSRSERSAPGFWETVRDRWDILGVIAAGGALGSLARWGTSELFPHAPSHFPFSTLIVNVLGSFLLGALMVFVLEVWPPTRYIRPFWGVGVMGGFTTFSTFMLDNHALATSGEVVLTVTYAVVSVGAALAAIASGVFVARATAQALHRRHAPVLPDPGEPEIE